MRPLRWTHAERLAGLIADLRARGHFVTTADKLPLRPCPDPEPSAEPAVAVHPYGSADLSDLGPLEDKGDV